MGWFTRRADPPAPGSPGPREGRLGPPPALARTAESPGVRVSHPAAAHAAIAELASGPAAQAAVADALRGAVSGTTLPGIAGMRVLHRDEEETILRFGPPPGVRWALREVRAVAVFTGKLTFVDGGEAREVRAGGLALVARPEATLYLEAGNDSAVALAVAGPGFAASLA